MEDKLYEIYEMFLELLIDKGWNGQNYGWKETQRAEALEGGWAHFRYDNGFNLRFTYEGNGQEHARLQYWFDEIGELVEVESLGQLLQLVN